MEGVAQSQSAQGRSRASEPSGTPTCPRHRPRSAILQCKLVQQTCSDALPGSSRHAGEQSHLKH